MNMLKRKLMLATSQFPKHWYRPVFLALGILILTVVESGSESSSVQGLARVRSFVSPVAIAAESQNRIIRIRDVWQKVYQELPDLPKENQYISRDTGEAASEDTLIGRLIRYHVYVKGRSPLSRFDWKLTLADYLGVNDRMLESQYPGAGSLRENPLNGDRETLKTFKRKQRQELVDTLVYLFDPNASETLSDSSSTLLEEPTETPPENPISPLPPLPQPGDAELLQL